MLIDSHCHLSFDDFKDIESVLQNAYKNGVDKFIAIGPSDNLKTSYIAVELANKYDDIFATTGIHPHDASFYSNEIEKEIYEIAKNKKIIAIGETGLDYFYNHSPREVQIESFTKQIEIAVNLNLPVIIHTRDANEDTIEIISNAKAKYKNLKFLFHCFSGNEELMKFGLENNIKFSFSGIITFKKSIALQEIVKKVPLSEIMVETDAPFLAPEPFRGKTNEPALVYYTAKKIAELKGIEFDEVAKITRQNTINFFEMPCK